VPLIGVEPTAPIISEPHQDRAFKSLKNEESYKNTTPHMVLLVFVGVRCPPLLFSPGSVVKLLCVCLDGVGIRPWSPGSLTFRALLRLPNLF
jgi:hypothetical protein